MNTKLLVSLATVACTTLAFAAEGEDSTQFQAYPKNLARQHLGTNLLQFNTGTKTFTSTQAAAAWLDDDITTGWPVMSGKQYHLITLPRAELVTNFSLSTRPTEGKVSLYGSDVAAAPDAASWNPLLKDVPLESVNQKMSRDFSRVAKYILVETEITTPGPLYSLYLYSHKPAVSYDLKKRDQAVQPKAVFGPYVNDATAVNVASLYAHSTVSQSGESADPVSLQRAIDDNPETAVTIAPGDKLTTIRYREPHTVSRVALLSDSGAQGKLDLFLTDGDSPADAAPPTISLVLDGTNPRTSVDFPASSASEMRMRWTPTNGTDPLTVREINAFGEAKLTSYAVNATAGTPAAVVDRQLASEKYDRSTRSKSDGKETRDAKDAKDAKNLEEIAAGPGESSPFLPGSLGFPPNVNGRLPRDFPLSQ
jgi:hypothetical protein